MERLPEGTQVTTTTAEPSDGAERYEWVPDEKRTYEELPVSEIRSRSEHVSRVFAKWSAKLTAVEAGERDDRVREIMLSVDQPCIDFAMRFPHRFKHLTDSTLIADPYMARHQSAMLAIFDKKQRGEITEDRAKQLVSQLAQRTILDKTAALSPAERRRRKKEVQDNQEGSKRVH